MDLLVCTIVIVVATGVVWHGSEALDSSAKRLAAYHRLPPLVHGGVIVAVGSSFPELSTTVLSTWVHGAFDLGVAAIVGSAVFNVLVIPALAALHGGEQRFSLGMLYKDALFYLVAIAVSLLTFVLATVYRPVEASEGSGLAGEMLRSDAVLPLALYALYLFLQQQESEEHRRTTEFASDVQPVREWLRLALGLGWIVLGVEALVRSALWLGDAFDIPDFFWGATVVAASTSLPDALVSVRAARRAESEVSLANVFGSNTFDLLVAVPAGVLVAGTAVVHLEFAVPMFGFLAAATLALFVSLRVGLSLGRREAWFLLALYAVFAGWLGLEAAGVIGWTSSGR